MVCKNCGSDNVRGAKSCNSCNFPLPSERVSIKQTPIQQGEPSLLPPPAAPALPPPVQPPTKAGVKPFVVKRVCPQCRYELIFEAEVCPMCSFSFGEKTDLAPAAAEINNNMTSPTQEKVTPPLEKPTKPSPPPAVVIPTEPEAGGSEIELIKPESFEGGKSKTDESQMILSKYQMESIPSQSQPELIPSSYGKSIRVHSKPTTSPFNSNKGKRASIEGTIDPFRKDHSSLGLAFLKPIPREGEQESDSISLSGGDQPLPVNRTSLDPDNNTITSKTQAIFEFRDGGWYLTDKSEQQTTFIRASGTVKLEKGDVILMGNRKFIFDC